MFSQILRRGVWGAVCSAGWDDADASVACAQLGFPAGAAAPDIRFPTANARNRWSTIHLYDVQCQAGPDAANATNANATSGVDVAAAAVRLEDCPSAANGTTCFFADLAAVRCYADAATAPGRPPPAPPPPPVEVDECTTCVTVTLDASLGRSRPLYPAGACDLLGPVVTALLEASNEQLLQAAAARGWAAELALAPPLTRPFSCAAAPGGGGVRVCGAVADGATFAAFVTFVADINLLGTNDLRELWTSAVQGPGLIYDISDALFFLEQDYDYGRAGSRAANPVISFTTCGPDGAQLATWYDTDVVGDTHVRVPLLSPPPTEPGSSRGEERGDEGPPDAPGLPPSLPHGTLRLVHGPVRGHAGVVQLSHCGYLGTLAMSGVSYMELTRTDPVPRRGLAQPPGDRVGIGGGTDSFKGLQTRFPNKTVDAMRAAAVCTQMGFMYSRAKRGSQRFGVGTGLVFDAAPVCYWGTFDCVSSATCLPAQGQVYPGACRALDVQLSVEDHDLDLSVECWDTPADLQPPPYSPQPGDLPAGSLRLMSYSSEAERWTAAGNTSLGAEGFVQILRRGVWGAVCSAGWDDADASIACAQLGFPAGVAAPDIRFPAAQARNRWSTIHLYDVQCQAGTDAANALTTAATAGGANATTGIDAAAAAAVRLEDCPSAANGTTCFFADLAAVRCYTNAASAPGRPPPAPPPVPPAEVDECTTCVTVTLDEASLGRSRPLYPAGACDLLAPVVTTLLEASNEQLLQEATTGGRAAELALAPPLTRPFSCAAAPGGGGLRVCGAVADGAAFAAFVAYADTKLRMLWLSAVQGPGLLYDPRSLTEQDYDYGEAGEAGPAISFSTCAPSPNGAQLAAWVETNSPGDNHVRVALLSPPPSEPGSSRGEERGDEGPPDAPGLPPRPGADPKG
ncbi:hypothetical protein TSOC_010988 [Tetrabaena socialis]|uniref:SRCR domain-containing protein n=1 Tax=Tetrabaena socialis TaxID=47790 RepID=A0A2J7ZRY3_9CHLO|nr:hypothetical protein TSOC_010988 [Tetrabaena socialis]|eukprot:PNH02990.1 hypothetical protein TSOC_010988 [Tetrabaena socialis]